MAEIKTKLTKESAAAFVRAVKDDGKRKDAQKLLKLFADITGEKPKMWGTSIVGYGTYHYKSERSSQEGDWMLTGFSPRKQNLSLYILAGFDGQAALLKRLGKHKLGVGCLYINSLDDVKVPVLKQIIAKSYRAMRKRHQVR